MAQPTEVKGEHRSVLGAVDAEVQTLRGLADFNVVGHAIEQREHDVVGDAVEPENRHRISAESWDDFQPRIARDDGRAEKEARGGRADDELRGLLRAAQSLADERNRGLDGGIDLLEKRFIEYVVAGGGGADAQRAVDGAANPVRVDIKERSEEHTSELQSLRQ